MEVNDICMYKKKVKDQRKTGINGQGNEKVRIKGNEEERIKRGEEERIKRGNEEERINEMLKRKKRN